MKTAAHPHLHGRESGHGILLALTTIAILFPLVAICFNKTGGVSNLTRRDRDYVACNAAAEAALEYAFAKWKAWIKANGGRIPTVANCNNTSSPSSTQLGATPAEVQALFDATAKFNGATVTELVVEPVDGNDIPINGSLTTDQQKSAMRTFMPLESMPRRVGRAYNYRATVAVQMPSRGGPATARVTRYFRKTDASLWQAMMWYEGDLELFPTPDMTLYGWLHTNSNAYLAHSANSSNLTLNSDFTFSGSPSTLNKGTLSVTKDALGLVYGVSHLQETLEPSWQSWKEPIWNSGGYDSQVANVPRLDPLPVRREDALNPTDSNPNNDSLREIIERPADTNGDGKRTAADDTVDFADRRYYNVADFKIIVNRAAASPADRIKILDRNDVRLDPATNTFAANVINQALGKNSTTGLPSTKDFYDYRQAGNVTSSSASAADRTEGHVTVTNIDVSKLTPILNNPGNASYYTNGVIYFKDETPANTAGVNNTKAVRLQRGGSLPTTGMTIVTEDGLYVQGDYNTGTTYDSSGNVVTMPGSNQASGDPLDNVVSGYSLKSAALCADAVTFLSNAWQDSYTYQTATSARVGSATTFNTAFLSGHVPTNNAYGTENDDGSMTRSGGGINFPRVLENWNGTALTYHGSMVQLFDSKVFKTPWVPYIYGAAKRPWAFENRFLNDPPPGPLEFTEYSRGRFFRPLL
jgi:hypothetical protein